MSYLVHHLWEEAKLTPPTSVRNSPFPFPHQSWVLKFTWQSLYRAITIKTPHLIISEEISNQPAAGVLKILFKQKQWFCTKINLPEVSIFWRLKNLIARFCQTFLELKTRGKSWDFGCWGSFNNNWPIVQLTMSYAIYHNYVLNQGCRDCDKKIQPDCIKRQ